MRDSADAPLACASVRNDAWRLWGVVVVAGSPALRTPDGERELRPGDCIHFPSGEAGAHQIINRTDDEVRLLLVSSFANMPRASVQPDSGKMMVRWGLADDERAWFPLDAATDYWHGEQTGPR